MAEEEPDFFSFSFYQKLVNQLRERGFQFAFFRDGSHGWRVLMRHDVDLCLSRAHRFAEVERDLAVVSTYYLMLNSPAYNLAWSSNRERVRQMQEMGHEIGLHFVLEPDWTQEEMECRLLLECDILEKLTEHPVRSFSVHRPAYWSAAAGIKADELKCPGRVNTYGPTVFASDAYISDSNYHWRCGNPLEFVRSFQGGVLQILTHPIWWRRVDCVGISGRAKIAEYVSEKDAELRGYVRTNIGLVKHEDFNRLFYPG